MIMLTKEPCGLLGTKDSYFAFPCVIHWGVFLVS